ncbi:hypothetical protein CLV63_14324 [Murinocardiopsis flavida]|uniref:Uncharacterized protein n=2 Tax=Murinocardiopsis flavida TaxID=645275 RepID=A0A2P8CBA6_9ACTN|nr:hypothetical protein CLV63_14324 [Murinocardiopsis flavida]
MLARAYGNAAQLTYRFGWFSLASSGLDRMENAAAHSGQPLLTAHATQQRALICSHTRPMARRNASFNAHST